MNKQQISRIQRLDASVRFRLKGPTFEEHPQTGKPRQVDNGGTFCDVKDNTTGEFYATAMGDGESDALDKALDRAEMTEKPMTPAQKNDAANRKKILDDADQKVAAAESKATTLAEQLAAARAEIEAMKTAPQETSKASESETPTGNSRSRRQSH